MLNARDGVSLRPYSRLALPHAGVQMSANMAGLAVFDYAWQYWQFEKSLRIRKCDVEEENKSQEGGPQLKACIRGMTREMACKPHTGRP